jgi:hypothetical protein
VIFEMVVFMSRWSACFAVIAVFASPAAADTQASRSELFKGLACAKDDLECVDLKSTDRVRIRALGGNAYSVDVEIRFVGGHTCGFKGQGVSVGPNIVVSADGLTSNSRCEMTLDRSRPNRLRLTDKDEQCRKVYCGQRGRFTGATFSR